MRKKWTVVSLSTIWTFRVAILYSFCACVWQAHDQLTEQQFKSMSEKGEVDLTGAKQNTGVWLVKVCKLVF